MSTRTTTIGQRAYPVLVLFVLILVEVPASFAQMSPVDTTKSEGLAFACSFLGTLVPVVAAGFIVGDLETASDASKILGGSLSMVGLLIGPSLGHVYAGNESAISLGAVIRLTGLAIIGGGIVVNASQPERSGSKTGDIIATGGVAVVAAGALTDWIRAPLLLHKQKESARAAHANRIGLLVAPGRLKLLIQVG